MNAIKSISILALLLLITCSAALYTSCKKDKNNCKGVNCLNGGACNGGKCICPTGYGGTYCETDIDLCKGVTCLNLGTCNDGKCVCPTGSGGTHCESAYRDAFVNSYAGDGTDDQAVPDNYYTWKATFTATGTELTKMQIVVRDNFNYLIFTSTITLSNFVTSGAVFTIAPTYNSASGYNYVGSGIFNGNNLKLSFTRSGTSSSDTRVYTFSGMAKL